MGRTKKTRSRVWHALAASSEEDIVIAAQANRQRFGIAFGTKPGSDERSDLVTSCGESSVTTSSAFILHEYPRHQSVVSNSEPYPSHSRVGHISYSGSRYEPDSDSDETIPTDVEATDSDAELRPFKSTNSRSTTRFTELRDRVKPLPRRISPHPIPIPTPNSTAIFSVTAPSTGPSCAVISSWAQNTSHLTKKDRRGGAARRRSSSSSSIRRVERHLHSSERLRAGVMLKRPKCSCRKMFAWDNVFKRHRKTCRISRK